MQKQTADILLRGGSFWSDGMDASGLDFVAIRGNRILAAGPAAEADGYIGAQTKVYDYTKEQLILPGLHDSHIHLIQAGLLEKYADLFGAADEAEAVRIVADFAETIPDETWVMGFGWSKYTFPQLPTAASLDAVLPDRPVLLMDDELHAAWANSKAMELAGIDADTPDIPYGEIGRDADGRPNGYFNEHAMCAIAGVAWDFDADQVAQLVDLYAQKALSLGITSVTDMTPYLLLDLSFPEAYFTLAAQDRLKIRINAARNLFEDTADTLRIKARADAEGEGMYRVPYLKQFVDGVPGNYTGYLLADYSDKPGERGTTLLEIPKMAAAVKEAHDAGLSVRLHACGDAAVRAALDAYDAAIAANPDSPARHAVEHIEVIDPADIPRFGKLGVIASVQPEHIVSGMPSFSDNNYPELLGPEREKYTWVFRSLWETGATLIGGSDCPVVKGNPFVGIYSGIERVHDDGTPAGGWVPEQKLALQELLQMYTSKAAFAEGREAELGTLQPGMLADITVLDRNLLAIDTAEIPEAKAVLTVVDGIVRYEA